MGREKSYREAAVEKLAWDTLIRYSTMSQLHPTLPVPTIRIAEDLFDFGILWEPIPEPQGRTILAGLVPTERLIVFNETRRPLFADTPFLENTVLAHEIGHWQLHVDQIALQHPLLDGFDRPFQFVCQRGGNSTEEREAHWFASHLLLPRNLLATYIAGTEIRSLFDMYRLRDQLNVTITVMRIALERMGRAYVDEEGAVYPSKQEYNGQLRLL